MSLHIECISYLLYNYLAEQSISQQDYPSLHPSFPRDLFEEHPIIGHLQGYQAAYRSSTIFYVLLML